MTSQAYASCFSHLGATHPPTMGLTKWAPVLVPFLPLELRL